jgi:hypothetical protein
MLLQNPRTTLGLAMAKINGYTQEDYEKKNYMNEYL